ncbi:MAG: bifunctional 5,10-methylene-tetrahydrofolate dehydrogenase/5,10-methylene-tetrahydrofolate cyclohydrolase [Prevotellaceae bacterium]|jgi:methylenetetrahydrofolate dehydrogenase (NADP+)/methenyltetrahydrofolate cyclohydrolase|nr:bifunctional 5,10-methylene-tetrahydrofolate dehydrogenase/5,10-methylene-tetrahydrofolate cyclohydrolase [Prevotellaceae bacterium]
MTILDGKTTAQAIKEDIAKEVKQWVSTGRRPPHLTAILVGHDGASETYISHKESDCKQVGITSTIIRFEQTVTQNEILDMIFKINADINIDGIIVQLPMPKHINEQAIIEAIDPDKDVDGFHPVNVGRMVLGLPGFVPATPDGIRELIRHYNIETKGKHCVVLGRSHIVGRPMANLLSQKAYPGDCTVTVCHSSTPNIKELCLEADIIIAALGVPLFLKANMVKWGAVVIDVGITRVPTSTSSGFRLVGDVDFDAVAPKCSFITPVPGGVGPMTRVALLKNTLKAAVLHQK